MLYSNLQKQKNMYILNLLNCFYCFISLNRKKPLIKPLFLMIETACLFKLCVFGILLSKIKTCWGLETATTLSIKQVQKAIFLETTFIAAITPKIDIYLSQPQEIVQLGTPTETINDKWSNHQKIDDINNTNNRNCTLIENTIEDGTSKSNYYPDKAETIFRPYERNDPLLNVKLYELNETESFEQAYKMDQSSVVSNITVEVLQDSNKIKKLVLEALKQIYLNHFTVPDLPIVQSTVFVTKTVFEPEKTLQNNKLVPKITTPLKLEASQFMKPCDLSTAGFCFRELSKTRDPILQPQTIANQAQLESQISATRQQFTTGEYTKSEEVNSKDKNTDKLNSNSEYAIEGNNNLEDMLSASSTQDSKKSAKSLSKVFQKLKELIKTTFVLSGKSIEKIDNRTNNNKGGNDMSLIFGKRSSENPLLKSAKNLKSFENNKQSYKTEYTNNNKGILSYNKYNSMMGAAIAIVMLTLLV